MMVIDYFEGMPCSKSAYYTGGSFFYEDKEILFPLDSGGGIMYVITRAVSGMYGTRLPITVADDFYYMSARYTSYKILQDINKCTFYMDEFYSSTYGNFYDYMRDQVYNYDMDGGSIVNIPDKSCLPDEIGFLWPSSRQD